MTTQTMASSGHVQIDHRILIVEDSAIQAEPCAAH
jgi:hypothetical protein